MRERFMAFTLPGSLEHLAVGQPLKAIPLFLTPDDYINLPLEHT
jgi:hypothetical protein